MKFHVFYSIVILTMTSSNLFAQHAGDLEFGYDSLAAPTSFVIESTDFTSDGFLYFESEMEELDPFNPGDFSSDEPGFTTNDGEGLLVNEGDQIWLNAVDASSRSTFGVGYVNYYDPTSGTLTSLGRLGIYDNSGSTSDLILSGGSIESGPNTQFIGLGDVDGDVHDHLIVDLLDDATAPNGAYGVMFELQSDFSAADGTMDLTSDAFWIVWNHGMSDADFDSLALPAFGVSAVPEPGSLSLLAFGVPALVLRRRRKRA
ncbi:MAG: PEP-CTERM sorting domain-containing protein [Mariniblastus sp.]|nr:PEP-CTERM sorting domain-containing protein [Mariniblastus sp.]